MRLLCGHPSLDLIPFRVGNYQLCPRQFLAGSKIGFGNLRLCFGVFHRHILGLCRIFQDEGQIRRQTVALRRGQLPQGITPFRKIFYGMGLLCGRPGSDFHSPGVQKLKPRAGKLRVRLLSLFGNDQRQRRIFQFYGLHASFVCHSKRLWLCRGIALRRLGFGQYIVSGCQKHPMRRFVCNPFLHDAAAAVTDHQLCPGHRLSGLGVQLYNLHRDPLVLHRHSLYLQLIRHRKENALGPGIAFRSLGLCQRIRSRFHTQNHMGRPVRNPFVHGIPMGIRNFQARAFQFRLAGDIRLRDLHHIRRVGNRHNMRLFSADETFLIHINPVNRGIQVIAVQCMCLHDAVSGIVVQILDPDTPPGICRVLTACCRQVQASRRDLFQKRFRKYPERNAGQGFHAIIGVHFRKLNAGFHIRRFHLSPYNFRRGIRGQNNRLFRFVHRIKIRRSDFPYQVTA